MVLDGGWDGWEPGRLEVWCPEMQGYSIAAGRRTLGGKRVGGGSIRAGRFAALFAAAARLQASVTLQPAYGARISRS